MRGVKFIWGVKKSCCVWVVTHRILFIFAYIDDAVDQDVNDVDHGDLNGTPST